MSKVWLIYNALAMTSVSLIYIYMQAILFFITKAPYLIHECTETPGQTWVSIHGGP